MIDHCYINDVMLKYNSVKRNGFPLTFSFTDKVIVARFGWEIVFDRYWDDIRHSEIVPLIDEFLMVG